MFYSNSYILYLIMKYCLIIKVNLKWVFKVISRLEEEAERKAQEHGIA